MLQNEVINTCQTFVIKLLGLFSFFKTVFLYKNGEIRLRNVLSQKISVSNRHHDFQS